MGNRQVAKGESIRSGRQDTLAGAACELYHADLHRFLMRRLRSSQEAQDLAQEAYLRLLRVERDSLVRKPRAYLYRIATHLVYELRLREQREVVTFDSTVLEEAAEAVEAPAQLQDERLGDEQSIGALLERLPPLYSAILVLRKRDGLSYEEIARELDISVHTVKKYLARAVAMCREAMGHEAPVGTSRG